jgi:RNA polymerase sigma-70 factor, ECF subfamily
MSDDFHDQLISRLPQMRIWALALTRNRAAAEDLVQDTATKALLAQDRFIPGTNFGAWIHRIMTNHFISGVRKQRMTTELDDTMDLPVAAAHEDRLALRELAHALDRLAPDQREALFMIVLQEMPYEDAAAIAGCAVGTMKSRVHRTRAMLRAWLMGERSPAAEQNGEVRPRRGRPPRRWAEQMHRP